MAYLDILKSSELGELREMSKNCQADYIWIPNITEDNTALPIKYRKEPDSLKWTFRTKYIGLYILEFIDDTFLVISSDELNLQFIRSTTLRYRYASRFIKSNEILHEFEKFYDKSLKSLDDINKMTYYTEASREDCIKRNGHNCELEAKAHAEFDKILLNNMKLTGEGCLADWAFHIGNLSQVIGIQTKTSSIDIHGNMFKFYKCDKYDGMLLLCRPMPKIPEGTIVIPGGMVHIDSIGLTINEETKYYPYLIKDDYLAEFMLSMYESIANKSCKMTWPSGIEVDISSIKFYKFSELNIPTSKSSRVEYENSEWRKAKFPSINYSVPLVQGTTVDQIINGITVQDKSAILVGRYLSVNLSKSGGRNNVQVCYEEKDFECLWLFPNNSRRYIFIIPMFKLVEKGFIKTDTRKGKTTLHCYDKSYIKAIRGPKTDLWTQTYCIDTEDADIQDKVINILESFL